MAPKEALVRLAENVAVLHVFDALPGDSSDNHPPSKAIARDLRRVLSFERERFLASGLAALADISDDPNHVVAVAVEERPSTQGLAVLVSINRANAASAEGTMAKIKGGLQDIFSVLAKVGHGLFPLSGSGIKPDGPQTETRHMSMKCSAPSFTSVRPGYSSVWVQSGFWRTTHAALHPI